MTTIASIIPSSPRPLSEVSKRIGGLLEERRGQDSWWAELISNLDELAGQMMAEANEVWRGMSDQIKRDAPHMTSNLRRLDNESDALLAELLRIRVLTGESANDPQGARQVRDSVHALLRKIRRHDERETQTIYDAYERDIGGEGS